MLPGDWHPKLAELALAKSAHFVSSSYISPEMKSLHVHAQLKGLCFVNEVGLDPGIDHLMAHHLVASYRASKAYDAGNTLSFTSYCGGVPKHSNAFRYKFSWSPLGVLKALRSPSKSIRSFAELTVQRPWDAVTRYTAPLSQPETFEVYPNRDSLPFMDDYNFDPTWKVKDFVRGTMRLNGWTEAWQDIFTEMETLSGPEGDDRMAEMSAELWDKYAYDEDEPDRVVLCVSLQAESEEKTVWHQTYVMDAWGDARGSAMARLVSIPVSLAVEAVLAREIKPGVTAAPSDPRLIKNWMTKIDVQAQHLRIIDHCA
jgi:saccharopine dehydrogenase (NADP+, L-glutamate forming)